MSYLQETGHLENMETNGIAPPYIITEEERQKAGIGAANQL
jgi:hypothetical protein